MLTEWSLERHGCLPIIPYKVGKNQNKYKYKYGKGREALRGYKL